MAKVIDIKEKDAENPMPAGSTSGFKFQQESQARCNRYGIVVVGLCVVICVVLAGASQSSLIRRMLGESLIDRTNPGTARITKMPEFLEPKAMYDFEDGGKAASAPATDLTAATTQPVEQGAVAAAAGPIDDSAAQTAQTAGESAPTDNAVEQPAANDGAGAVPGKPVNAADGFLETAEGEADKKEAEANAVGKGKESGKASAAQQSEAPQQGGGNNGAMAALQGALKTGQQIGGEVLRQVAQKKADQWAANNPNAALMGAVGAQAASDYHANKNKKVSSFTETVPSTTKTAAPLAAAHEQEPAAVVDDVTDKSADGEVATTTGAAATAKDNAFLEEKMKPFPALAAIGAVVGPALVGAAAEHLVPKLTDHILDAFDGDDEDSDEAADVDGPVTPEEQAQRAAKRARKEERAAKGIDEAAKKAGQKDDGRGLADLEDFEVKGLAADIAVEIQRQDPAKKEVDPAAIEKEVEARKLAAERKRFVREEVDAAENAGGDVEHAAKAAKEKFGIERSFCYLQRCLCRPALARCADSGKCVPKTTREEFRDGPIPSKFHG
ncbi:unnamed protein product [Amoebophrya sp. A120]|nr:unnamed protein product [Amoebophrya sp. A120]|eukprot:GSA120T00015967001.1